MSIRFVVNLESSLDSFTLPKSPPSGGEWEKIRLVKAFYNQTNASTNRILMFNIDECENDGYYESSGGAITRYAFSYIIGHNADTDEYRLYNDRFIDFKNTKTDKLTIKVSDVTGYPTDITSTHYVILEFEINCRNKNSY